MSQLRWKHQFETRCAFCFNIIVTHFSFKFNSHCSEGIGKRRKLVSIILDQGVWALLYGSVVANFHKHGAGGI